MRTLSWEEVTALVAEMAGRLDPMLRSWPIPKVYGVPTGGAVVAALLKAHSPAEVQLVDDPGEANLIVDDLVDTGRTALRALDLAPGAGFEALIRKAHSPKDLAPGANLARSWVVFPWERRIDGTGEDSVADGVTRLLQFVGEDPTRSGLQDTPARVAKAYREMTEGYRTDLAATVKVFSEPDADEMVLLRGIRFVSLCEHHLLPFHGEATVGYLPADGRIIGLSKLARIVHAYARRLQVQERLTREVAGYLMNHEDLRPLGVGVVVRAHHSCMSCRGVRELNGEMVTSATLGRIRDHDARSEFLRLAGG